MTSIATDADYLIIQRVKEGDERAMHELYCRYVRYLSAVCLRYVGSGEDTKDVLQNVFMKIFSSVDKFEYRGEGSLKGWMTKILLNESLKFIKSKGRLQFVELDGSMIDVADDEPDTEGVPPDVIHSMICELPDGYRTVFNLYVIEGKSHREIAEMLGIKENTSASQLNRAKSALAAKIKKYNALYSPSK